MVARTPDPVPLSLDRLGGMVFLDHEVADDGRATLEAAEAEDWGYAIPSARSFTAMVVGFEVSTD